MKAKFLITIAVLAVLLIGGGSSFTGGPAGAETPPEQGTVTEIQYLGAMPRDVDGRYAVNVYFVKYQTFGNLQGAGILAVPIGTPPAGGWPMRVATLPFGSLGIDLGLWPYVGPFTNARPLAPAYGFATHGIVSLGVWPVGAGPADGTQSSFSSVNVQSQIDAFRALLYLDANRPDIVANLDETRQVYSGYCVSSPAAMRFLRSWRNYPELQLKIFAADAFLPSIAYVGHFRWLEARNWPGRLGCTDPEMYRHILLI